MPKPFVSDTATADRDKPTDYRKSVEGGPKSSGAPGVAPKKGPGTRGPKSPYNKEPLGR